MKIRKLFLIIALSLVLSSCKEGAESISELSIMVFKALKSQNQKMLYKCGPTPDELANGLESMSPTQGKSKNHDKQAKYRVAAIVREELNKEYDSVIQGAKERNINWSQTTFKDMNYTLHDHPQDYKDANVRIIILAGKLKYVIRYKAYLFANRWYLLQGLGWEE